jgi:hypothetical protein
MTYYIHGKVHNRIITLVGYTTSADIPGDTIILQEVERHPDVHVVKWSLRFADSLADKKILDHPFAGYFTNSARTKRLLKEEDFAKICAEENAKFLRFHQRRPELLEKFIETALSEKRSGRPRFSMRKLVGDIRWCDDEIEHDAERFKVDDRWSSWYSRVMQMLEPELLGFFKVRAGIVADSLVWIDDRTWNQFAEENKDTIRWTDPLLELLPLDSECAE